MPCWAWGRSQCQSVHELGEEGVPRNLPPVLLHCPLCGWSQLLSSPASTLIPSLILHPAATVTHQVSPQQSLRLAACPNQSPSLLLSAHPLLFACSSLSLGQSDHPLFHPTSELDTARSGSQSRTCPRSPWLPSLVPARFPPAGGCSGEVPWPCGAACPLPGPAGPGSIA